MPNLIKAVLLLALTLAVVLFRRTLKSIFLKFVKPVGVKVITAFQAGL